MRRRNDHLRSDLSNEMSINKRLNIERRLLWMWNKRPQAVGRVAITAIVPGNVTYHVYWDGRIEKHIPRAIQKGYEDKYKYIYHDEKGQKYEIGFASIKPTKVYGAKSGTVNLFVLRCVQDVYRDGNKHYKLTINSQRTYANEYRWASLLGEKLEVCFDGIVCNGFSMSDGSPGVSSSHLNEKNDDKRYLRKDRSGKILTSPLLRTIMISKEKLHGMKHYINLVGKVY